MSMFKRKSISYTQIPAMQMFTQAEQGTSTWEEAAYACYLAGLTEEAQYADRMARGVATQNASNKSVEPTCSTCGGKNGSHRFGCKSIIGKIRSGSR